MHGEYKVTGGKLIVVDLEVTGASDGSDGTPQNAGVLTGVHAGDFAGRH